MFKFDTTKGENTVVISEIKHFDNAWSSWKYWCNMCLLSSQRTKGRNRAERLKKTQRETEFVNDESESQNIIPCKWLSFSAWTIPLSVCTFYSKLSCHSTSDTCVALLSSAVWKGTQPTELSCSCMTKTSYAITQKQTLMSLLFVSYHRNRCAIIIQLCLRN